MYFFIFILVVNMEGKIIQLPYGVISEKNDPENELQFNFPPNFEKIFYLTSCRICLTLKIQL